MTCPTCGGVLADMRGTAFNAKQMRAAGVCALWADDQYECAFKDSVRARTVRMLASDIRRNGTPPFRDDEGEIYDAENKLCAFIGTDDLRAMVMAELERT